MHIGFIEDTHLRGGTQLRVMRAMKYFKDQGHSVSLISPAGSPVEAYAQELHAATYSYDFDDIVHHPEKYEATRIQGVAHLDVAICTVHPPREGFHCSIYAARCISKANSSTVLIPKTGTIVPSYLREYYYQEDGIKRHVICITDFTRQYLIDSYHIPSSQISLIYQGTSLADTTLDEEVLNQAYATYPVGGPDDFVFLQLGMIEYRKAWDISLAAFNRLHTTCPNTSLLFVGEGPDLAQLQTSAATFHGIYVYPFTSIPQLALARCNCLLLPSREKEGLPNVILEAMAMKKVVIAAELGGIAEVIEHQKTGFLIPPGDEEVLYEYMQYLVTHNNEYNALATHGQEHIYEHFDETKQFQSFLVLFDQLTKTL